MKKFIFFFLVLFMSAMAAVVAQTPAAEPDTVPDPVQEGDPAVEHLPRQHTDYVKDMNRMRPEEIPGPVRKTLEGDSQYDNWEKALIYQNKKKDEYLIQFKEGATTTSYRIDKNGKPVRDD